AKPNLVLDQGTTGVDPTQTLALARYAPSMSFGDRGIRGEAARQHSKSPTAFGASALDCRDTIDFDVKWSRPRRHVQEDAGRGVSRKIAGIDFVEDAEMRCVRRAVDIALQHAIQGRTGSFKAKPHLLQNQLRLPCEWHALDLAGLRIERR